MGFLLMRWAKILFSPIIFFCMFPRILLLTLCVVIGYLESIGRSSSCCGPKLGGNCHHRFRDHLASEGCWFKGPLLGEEGVPLAGRQGHTAGSDGSSIVHACPTLHDWCRVPIVEEWHSLCQAACGWFGLWWVQWDSSHAFSHGGGMYSFPLLSFLLFLHFMVTLKCDACVRLVLPLVVLLTLFIYLGQSMLMTLTTLLESTLWGVTQIS